MKSTKRQAASVRKSTKRPTSSSGRHSTRRLTALCSVSVVATGIDHVKLRSARADYRRAARGNPGSRTPDDAAAEPRRATIGGSAFAVAGRGAAGAARGRRDARRGRGAAAAAARRASRSERARGGRGRGGAGGCAVHSAGARDRAPGEDARVQRPAADRANPDPCAARGRRRDAAGWRTRPTQDVAGEARRLSASIAQRTARRRFSPARRSVPISPRRTPRLLRSPNLRGPRRGRRRPARPRDSSISSAASPRVRRRPMTTSWKFRLFCGGAPMAEAAGVGRLWPLRDEIVGPQTRANARRAKGFAPAAHASVSAMQKSDALNKSLFLL